MRNPFRKPSAPEPGRPVGVVRVDARTKKLTKRLRAGEFAVIDHSDLDRVAAESLVECRPAAVLNAAPSISGRYPNLGPGILIEAGIPLIDDLGPDVMRLKEGQRVVLDLAEDSPDRRDPLVPGEPVEVEIDMWATGVHVPAGHRLRLDLAGSCWPRYAVADPAGGAPVRLTVLHDAEHPSELVLPLIDLDAHPAAL